MLLQWQIWGEFKRPSKGETCENVLHRDAINNSKLPKSGNYRWHIFLETNKLLDKYSIHFKAPPALAFKRVEEKQINQFAGIELQWENVERVKRKYNKKKSVDGVVSIYIHI